MKKILMLCMLIAAGAANAQVHVNAYTKKDGTYVQAHQRTAPDHTTANNYSTQGNVNPYTGQAGTQPNRDLATPQQTIPQNPYPQPTQQSQQQQSIWNAPKR